jgi:hypothetical protein
MNRRRIKFTLGAAAGVLGAALLPMAVAFADTSDFQPDLTTFNPTNAIGYPPFDNELIGTEDWSRIDLTSGVVQTKDFFEGVDTQTTIGTFTNDDFLATVLSVTNFVGTQIDLANFGGGFENEWIDVPNTVGAPFSGISDLLITPFGDFPLLGTAFG